MNHNSIGLTEPTQLTPALDPEAKLVIWILLRAARDYQVPYYRRGLHEFFASDWYKCLLDYLTVCIPGFEFEDYILPEGIVSGSERSVVTE